MLQKSVLPSKSPFKTKGAKVKRMMMSCFPTEKTWRRTRKKEA